MRRLLRRCLEKDPKRRLRDIGDARIEIDASDEVLPGVTATPVSLAGAGSRTTWRPWVARVASIAGSLAALAGTVVAIATLDNGRQKSHRTDAALGDVHETHVARRD